MNLLDYRSNIYSQNGEDGVLAELFRRMGSDSSAGWCVEFGAWDGKHLSNTFQFVESNGWNAVYIESDEMRFLDLEATARDVGRIVAINALVGAEKNGGLDEILKSTKLPKEYQLLSIDIDSYDLAVWNEHIEYDPQVVVIEINSSIPPGVLQWHRDGHFQGNSFSSTVAVARAKGYSLVCHTGNLIFVRDDLVSVVELSDSEIMHPERLFISVTKPSPTRHARIRQVLRTMIDPFYLLGQRVLGDTVFRGIIERVLGKRGSQSNTP